MKWLYRCVYTCVCAWSAPVALWDGGIRTLSWSEGHTFYIISHCQTLLMQERVCLYVGEWKRPTEWCVWEWKMRERERESHCTAFLYITQRSFRSSIQCMHASTNTLLNSKQTHTFTNTHSLYGGSRAWSSSNFKLFYVFHILNVIITVHLKPSCLLMFLNKQAKFYASLQSKMQCQVHVAFSALQQGGATADISVTCLLFC